MDSHLNISTAKYFLSLVPPPETVVPQFRYHNTTAHFFTATTELLILQVRNIYDWQGDSAHVYSEKNPTMLIGSYSFLSLYSTVTYICFCCMISTAFIFTFIHQSFKSRGFLLSSLKGKVGFFVCFLVLFIKFPRIHPTVNIYKCPKAAKTITNIIKTSQHSQHLSVSIQINFGTYIVNIEAPQRLKFTECINILLVLLYILQTT